MRDRTHISFDLAKKNGWCAGVPFSKPVTGHFTLAGKTRAERYMQLRTKLIVLLATYDPIVAFIEEPLDPNFAVKVGITRDTMMSLNGYVAIAEMMCAVQGVETQLIERKLALEHFTGRSGYKEDDGAKKACVARCNQLGYPIEGYDAADAAAQWDFGCARRYAGAYAMVRSTLPATMKGYDDAHISGNRSLTRRRKPRGKRGAGLFD